MNYEVGKSYHFYNNDAKNNVCKAHILHIMPHPEADGVFLIILQMVRILSQMVEL